MIRAIFFPFCRVPISPLVEKNCTKTYVALLALLHFLLIVGFPYLFLKFPKLQCPPIPTTCGPTCLPEAGRLVPQDIHCAATPCQIHQLQCLISRWKLKKLKP